MHRLAVLLLPGAFLCSVLLLGCGGGENPVPEPATEVTIPGLGKLRGASPSDAVTYFMGIPYGKAPTGELRWKPPQAYGAWEEGSPRDATAFGEDCAQHMNGVGLVGSEDCLFLNVAAPATALGSTARLPVMFWIHGGAYQTGSSNSSVATADTLVAASGNSVVVVTTNYRLNVFGFLGSAEIAGSTSDNSAGNFGIQDQRLAMKWVKDHISAFGGDPNSITIFGESAGGNAVINHLAQSNSFEYYTKAIIQSGTYNEGARSMILAEESYEKFKNDLQCGDLTCLLAKDAATILANRGSAGSGPVVDGVELTSTPANVIAEGRHNKVPILMGAVRDENLSPWFFPYNQAMNEAQFDAYYVGIDQTPGGLESAKEVYDPSVYTYPGDLGTYSQWAFMLGRMLTDQVPGLGHCGVRWLAKDLLAAGTPAVYAYSFDHPPQRESQIPGDGPGSVIAAHACEIAFVFGHTFQLTPGEEQRLARDTSAYFVAFAKTGIPNSEGLPAWPAYDEQTDTTMHLDVGQGGIRTQQNFRKGACDFWEFGNTTDLAERIFV